MTSSANERKMSSLTSRSCRTHALRSSRRLGCVVSGFVVEFDSDMDFGPASGIGIGHAPSQYLHVPLVSSANLTLRRHLENSGPLTSSPKIGTPGRREEMS